MIQRFKKKILNNSDVRNLFQNFGYLVLLNFANFILPLISFPYVVRTIGIEKFGLLSFSLSIVNYFIIITDFSFNLSATREIAISRHDSKKIDEIVSAVLVIKTILLLACAIVLIILLFTVSKLSQFWHVHLFTFGVVIGQVLFPVWFFQGIEKMKTITYLNIFSKVLYTILIFIFVKRAEDFYLVPIFSSFGSLIIGVYSLIYIKSRFKVNFFIPKKDTLIEYIRNGWTLFLSNISVTLYTSAITTILGFFSSNIVVGYYSVAERLISAIRGMISPISQSLFPFLSKLAVTSESKVLHVNRKLLLFFTPFFACVSVFLYFFSSEILTVLFKSSSSQSALVLKILSPIPVLIYLHTIFALFTMIVFGRNKEYTRIIVSGGFFNVILAFSLIPFYHHVGAAICVIVIEFYILIRYVLFTETNGLKIIKKIS